MAVDQAGKRVRTKPAAGGPGKQGKKFAEDAGISHLLELGQAITQAKDESLSKRIEHSKLKAQAHQLKKQSAQRNKTKPSTNTTDIKPKSKAEIKAALKSEARQKAKARKEARKQKLAQSKESKTDSTTKPKKSVSFA